MAAAKHSIFAMAYLDEVLKKLGWQDGFQIPVANVENKRLEEELARLSLDKFKAKAAFETAATKLESLENHLKYVTQESEQNQSLITAHAQQLQAEEHKLKTDLAEREKCEQEIRLTGKKIAEVEERQQVQRHTLERYTRRLEKMKSETDWDQEALQAWEESLRKRDDDNELIKKFSKQDHRKYNELEARRQNLEVEYFSRKRLIEKTISDLSNYERVLERTGKVIKQQVTERNALIEQWKDAVQILHQRDADIDRLQTQILETQEVIAKEEEKLEEQKQFHDGEIGNNEQLEHETQQLNMLNSRMRRDLADLIQHVLLLNGQADTLRHTMISTANQLERERGRKKALLAEIADQERKIAKIRSNIDLLREKSLVLKETMLSSDEAVRQLGKVVDYEQKQQKVLQNDAEMLQNAYFRAQQELQEEVHVGKTREMEIYGAVTNVNHLRKHIDDKRKALGKGKEAVYELDFKIDEIEQNILVNENVIQSEDKEELEAKLGELETKMAEHTEVRNLLKDQVNKISDDMRRLTLAIFNDQQQSTVLKDKLQHQNLSYEGGQKQFAALKNDIRAKQVEESILRLRVNQLNKAMKKEEKDIYTLQKFKLNLEQATQERLLEIDTHKEVLLVKRRNLNEDKGRLKCDITERKIRLEQFRKKYDIVLTSLGKDEEGKPFSITHFKIKNAQEKFLLQQEGDELDSKIKKAEKEIVAMENTLKVVNLTNAAFKQSLTAVDDDGKEMEEMKMLENQMLLVNDALRENKKAMAKKRQELEEIQSALQELELKKDQATDAITALQEEFVKVNKDIDAKEEKLKRAEHCLKIVAKKIQQKNKEKYDRNLEIRQLKDANQSAMQRLVEMSVRYAEIAPLINRYTTEYSIKLPEKRSLSTLSTSSESTRSTQSCFEKETVSKSVKFESSGSNSSSSRSSAISKVVITFD